MSIILLKYWKSDKSKISHIFYSVSGGYKINTSMHGNIIELKRSNHSMWETCTSCSITDYQTKSTYMNEYAS